MDLWEACIYFRMSPTPKVQKVYSNESKVILFVASAHTSKNNRMKWIVKDVWLINI